jgi:hypothetical protein
MTSSKDEVVLPSAPKEDCSIVQADKTMLRDLTEGEISFIRSVANRLNPAARDMLLADLSLARAEEMLDDASLMRFHLTGYERGKFCGQHTYPIEGELNDADGTAVHVLLFADPADRLYELEFLRWGDGPLQAPDWTTLKLIEGLRFEGTKRLVYDLFSDVRAPHPYILVGLVGENEERRGFDPFMEFAVDNDNSLALTIYHEATMTLDQWEEIAAEAREHHAEVLASGEEW